MTAQFNFSNAVKDKIISGLGCQTLSDFRCMAQAEAQAGCVSQRPSQGEVYNEFTNCSSCPPRMVCLQGVGCLKANICRPCDQCPMRMRMQCCHLISCSKASRLCQRSRDLKVGWFFEETRLGRDWRLDASFPDQPVPPGAGAERGQSTRESWGFIAALSEVRAPSRAAQWAPSSPPAERGEMRWSFAERGDMWLLQQFWISFLMGRQSRHAFGGLKPCDLVSSKQGTSEVCTLCGGVSFLGMYPCSWQSQPVEHAWS